MLSTWSLLLLTSALVPAVFAVSRRSSAAPVAAFALADATAFACWLIAFVPASETLLRQGSIEGAMLLWFGLGVATTIGGAVYFGARDALMRQGSVSRGMVTLASVTPVLVHGMVLVRTATLS